LDVEAFTTALRFSLDILVRNLSSPTFPRRARIIRKKHKDGNNLELTQGLQGLKIALLIDFDNVILGVEEPGFDVELVVNALRSRGIVVMGRAYGDWYRHNRHRRKLMEQGIELVETPVFGPLIKNSADIRIVLDAFEIAMSQAHIDAFCLVSGDSDFLPLIKKLQYLGKTVIVIAGNKFTSDLVRRNCNEFVSYENLLAESVGATEDVSILEGAYQLLGRTIHTLHERGMDVRSSTVKQMMLQLNPAFSERTFGCNQFKQFLDKAHRAGIIKLGNRDTSSGEYMVLLPSDLEMEIPAVEPIKEATQRNGATQSGRWSNGRGERRRQDDRANERRPDLTADPTAAAKPEEAPSEEALNATPASGPNGTVEPFTEAETPLKSNEVHPTGANGAVPASVFLNRANLRRGRLRFSGKEKRTVQQEEAISQGLETASDVHDATPDLAAAPEEFEATATKATATSMDEANATEPVSAIPFTPVAEAATEEATPVQTKKRTTRGRRRKSAGTSEATSETAGGETAPVEADNAATVAQQSTKQTAKPRAAEDTDTAESPTGDTVTETTSNSLDQVIEEKAAKPTRRRRAPRKK